MNLELTRTAAVELHGALGSYLSDLRMEIADTDSYDYRQGLKARGPRSGGLDLVDFLTAASRFLTAA